MKRWNAKREPGQCRVCGCTETTPCVLYIVAVPWDCIASFHEAQCSWADASRTLCTNPKCLGIHQGARTILRFMEAERLRKKARRRAA